MLVAQFLLAPGLVGGRRLCGGRLRRCGTNSGAHPPQLADVIPPDQPFTRHLVNVDGLRLSVLEAGTGDPIIFVHGW